MNRDGKSAISRVVAEPVEFYFVPSSVRKSGLDFCAPAARPTFEHVRTMQQSVEQCGDSGGVAE